MSPNKVPCPLRGNRILAGKRRYYMNCGSLSIDKAQTSERRSTEMCSTISNSGYLSALPMKKIIQRNSKGSSITSSFRTSKLNFENVGELVGTPCNIEKLQRNSSMQSIAESTHTVIKEVVIDKEDSSEPQDAPTKHQQLSPRSKIPLDSSVGSLLPDISSHMPSAADPTIPSRSKIALSHAQLIQLI